MALLQDSLLDALQVLVQLTGELLNLVRVLWDPGSGVPNDTRQLLLQTGQGLLGVEQSLVKAVVD